MSCKESDFAVHPEEEEEEEEENSKSMEGGERSPSSDSSPLPLWERAQERTTDRDTSPYYDVDTSAPTFPPSTQGDASSPIVSHQMMDSSSSSSNETTKAVYAPDT